MTTDGGFLSHDDVTDAIREALLPLGVEIYSDCRPSLTLTAEGGDVHLEGITIRDGETLEIRDA